MSPNAVRAAPGTRTARHDQHPAKDADPLSHATVTHDVSAIRAAATRATEAGMKRCPKCQQVKPVADFYKDRHKASGRTSACCECVRAAARERMRQRRQAIPAAREANRANARSYRRTDREAVFDHYGRSCACCGSTERLTIDHVNGDGKQHRAEIGSTLHRWLVRNGFPDGFQTLCLPCNISKGTGSICRLSHRAAVTT